MGAEELGLLSAGARRLLEGAAVAGDPFDPELAAAIAERPSRRRWTTSMSCCGSTSSGRRTCRGASASATRSCGVRSTRARRAVGSSRPTSGHRKPRAARGTRRRRAPTTSSSPAASAIPRRSPCCARPARQPRGAHRGTAARWLGGALRLLSADAPAEERVALLVAQAEALAAVGQLEASRGALIECIALVPAASRLDVQLSSACAGTEHLLGRHEQAHARVLAALERLPAQRDAEAVALMLELAADGFYRVRPEPMVTWAERAASAARGLGDPPLTAAGVAMLSLAHAWAGDIPAARAHRDEAAALVDALSDDELARRLDAASNTANAELSLDLYAAARTHGERALSVARETGQGARYPSVTIVLASIATAEARFADSSRILSDGAESARLAGDAQGLAWMLLNIGLLTTTGQGDVTRGLAAAEECCELTRAMDRSYITDWSEVVLARALLQGGEARRASEALAAPAADGFLLIPCGWRVGAFELLTRCLLALDRPAEAAAAAGTATAHAERLGLPFATAMAERAAAAVALQRGDAAVAAERALASAARCDQLGAPVEVALSRALAGSAFALAGNRARALEELEWAAATLQAHEAGVHVLEAERELRRLGHRPHRTAHVKGTDAFGVGSLSARELEIARLVLDRKTNAAIAAELFLSLKTVESHMRNIFRKLGVSSRVEVARELERADRERGA